MPATARADAPIDRSHFARMTMGDASLGREVLGLFDRQSVVLLERIRTAGPEGAIRAAHTLKGSAQGIGAWTLAGAIEGLERSGKLAEANALTRLAALIAETRSEIARMLLER